MSDDLVKRLRGQYRVGPDLPSGEPEFGFRQFPAPKIQHEAADRITALEAENERLREALRAIADLLSREKALEAVQAKAIARAARAALGDTP